MANALARENKPSSVWNSEIDAYSASHILLFGLRTQKADKDASSINYRGFKREPAEAET